MNTNDQTPAAIVTPALIRINEVARQLPGRNGRPKHPATLHRWAERGVRGVKLRTEWVGFDRYTTWAWVREFFAACAETRKPGPRMEWRTPGKVARAHERAMAELRKMGVRVE